MPFYFNFTNNHNLVTRVCSLQLSELYTVFNITNAAIVDVSVEDIDCAAVCMRVPAAFFFHLKDGFVSMDDLLVDQDSRKCLLKTFWLDSSSSYWVGEDQSLTLCNVRVGSILYHQVVLSDMDFLLNCTVKVRTLGAYGECDCYQGPFYMNQSLLPVVAEALMRHCVKYCAPLAKTN